MIDLEIKIRIYFTKIGDVFEGTFNKNGLKHGVGRLRFADGSTYEGFFKDGFFHGLGTLVLTDKTKYEGIFYSYYCNSLRDVYQFILN